jgi:hypothetical protein
MALRERYHFASLPLGIERPPLGRAQLLKAGQIGHREACASDKGGAEARNVVKPAMEEFVNGKPK